MEPIYFESPAAWRAWLEEHHATETEVWIGMFKAHTQRVNLTWEQAVREALCFGWIDGTGKRVDDERKMQRFTPRKSTRWSAKNVRMVSEMEADGLMRDAGRAAFAARDTSEAPYSLGARPDRLPADLEAVIAADAAASAFWEAAPPSYRKAAGFYVTSAKREETRERRLARLIADSAAGVRLKHTRRT